MLVIATSRQFRDNQKSFLDQLDTSRQLIIKRGKDAFMVTRLTEVEQLSMSEELNERARLAEKQLASGQYREYKIGESL